MQTKPTYYWIVKQRLDEYGMTQQDLAQRLGITDGAVSHYLYGRNSNPDTRAKIVEILNLPEDTFSSGTKS